MTTSIGSPAPSSPDGWWAVLGPGAMADGDATAWRQAERVLPPPTSSQRTWPSASASVTRLTFRGVSEIAAVTDGVGALHDELDSVLRADVRAGESTTGSWPSYLR